MNLFEKFNVTCRKLNHKHHDVGLDLSFLTQWIPLFQEFFEICQNFTKMGFGPQFQSDFDVINNI